VSFQILIDAQDETDTERLLLVDGTAREAYSDTSVPTQYPVGAGRVITDHVQATPSILTVDILCTDTPRQELAEPLAFDHSIVVDTTDGIESRGPSRALEPRERARVLYQSLDQIRREARLLTITTALRQYDQMIITRLDPTVESSARMILIPIEFQRIEIARSEVVTAVVVRQPRLRAPVDSGGQNGEEIAANTPRRTALQAAQDFLASAL
jgi:hypothetical protein